MIRMKKTTRDHNFSQKRGIMASAILPEDLHNKVKIVSKANGMDMSSFFRFSVIQLLKKMESDDRDAS